MAATTRNISIRTAAPLLTSISPNTSTPLAWLRSITTVSRLAARPGEDRRRRSFSTARTPGTERANTAAPRLRAPVETCPVRRATPLRTSKPTSLNPCSSRALLTSRWRSSSRALTASCWELATTWSSFTTRFTPLTWRASASAAAFASCDDTIPKSGHHSVIRVEVDFEPGNVGIGYQAHPDGRRDPYIVR